MANESYVLFELGGATYALRSRDVQHIEMLEHVTPVPNTAACIEGVVFSRGQVIPAMNLRLRFGFPKEPHSLRTRIIVAQAQQRTIALIVDAAREFRSIAEESIRPVEQTLVGIDGNYLRGVATFNDQLVLILNLEAVLNHVSEIKKAPSGAVPEPSMVSA
jgi:purine-binding chemotaxis protein CheW